MRRKTNSGKLKALSDFFNKVSAAWFTAGVITPIFIETDNFLDQFSLFFVGTTMTLLFLWSSVTLVRGLEI